MQSYSPEGRRCRHDPEEGRDSLEPGRNSGFQEPVPWWGWMAFTAVLVVLALRCFHGVDDIDEAFNIAVARQIAMGQGMFVEIWTPYQIGNLFQSFFIRVFHGVTGESTEGLVLFLRIARVATSLAAALALFHLLKRRLQPVSAWGAAILFLFCEGYAGAHFPVFAQDYLLLVFFTLTVAALFACAGEPGGGKGRGLLLYAAGASAALMVWNYPTALPVAAVLGLCVFLLYRGLGNRRALGLAARFSEGGATVLLLASVLVWIWIGFGEFLLFFAQYGESNLLKRALFDPATIRAALEKCFIAAGTTLFLATLTLAVSRRVFRARSLPWLALFSAFSAGLGVLLPHHLGVSRFFAGGPFQISFIGLCSPLLALWWSDGRQRQRLKEFFIVVYLPCIAMFGAIMAVVFMGNVKPLVAFYPAGLIAFALIIESLASSPVQRESPKRIGAGAGSIVAIGVATLLVMLWTGHYNDVPPFQRTERIESGAYRFLSTSPERAGTLRQLQHDLSRIEAEAPGASLYISGRYRTGYLMTRMAPNTPSCFSGVYWQSDDGKTITDPIYVGYPEPGNGTYHWDETFRYFATSGLGLPGFMLLDKAEIHGEEIRSFLNSHYREALDRSGYIIYRRL